jgi:hypothetical protein
MEMKVVVLPLPSHLPRFVDRFNPVYENETIRVRGPGVICQHYGLKHRCVQPGVDPAVKQHVAQRLYHEVEYVICGKRRLIMAPVERQKRTTSAHHLLQASSVTNAIASGVRWFPFLIVHHTVS